MDRTVDGAAHAARTEWKKLLVDSTFTLALLTGMSVRTMSAKVVANLGWDKVRATNPVFAGDTLYAESKVLHNRESKSRPTQGIVTVLTRGLNQDGTEVMSFDAQCWFIAAAIHRKKRRAIDSNRRPRGARSGIKLTMSSCVTPYSSRLTLCVVVRNLVHLYSR